MYKFIVFLATLAVLQSTRGYIISDKNNQEKTIVMAFVIHRHGERTPDSDELALSNIPDIIQNVTYLDGLEALTAAGKRRSYQLGKYLRKRYGAGGLKLVCNLYRPQEITVRTTDKDRTKMTAQVAMAALYPPDIEQHWDDGLGRVWQPIPYNTMPLDQDYLRYYSNCQKFKDLMKEAKEDAIDREFKQYSDLYPVLREHTGKDFSQDPIQFETLIDLFKSQVSLGINIPQWAKEIFPRLEDAALKAYQLYFRNDEMVKIGGGVLLDEFVTAATVSEISGKPGKMNLFSAHDFNVGAFMDAAKVEGRSKAIPDYGAVFALELYKTKLDNDYYVLPVYLPQAGVSTPEILHIAGCESESFCELNKFKDLVKDNILTEVEFNNICDIRSSSGRS